MRKEEEEEKIKVYSACVKKKIHKPPESRRERGSKYA
jgi:hypothetical protein